jgi:hypothetical protein
VERAPRGPTRWTFPSSIDRGTGSRRSSVTRITIRDVTRSTAGSVTPGTDTVGRRLTSFTCWIIHPISLEEVTQMADKKISPKAPAAKTEAPKKDAATRVTKKLKHAKMKKTTVR